MGIRNVHWSNQNELIGYPLDDAASRTDDAGQLLPSSILQDLRVRWPAALGRFAFVSAVTVTSRIVTVLLSVTDSLTSDGQSAKLIAGLSLDRRGLEQGRTYPLEAFVPGAGGYIAIGSIEEITFFGKFRTPQQSLLSLRAARAYRPSPVSAVRLLGAETGLTGLVDLTATAPLQLVKASRTINGTVYDNVIVLKLVQPAAAVQGAVATQSIFATFGGKCSERVNAKSCGDPAPILSVNGVTPDCDGVITLDFRGCAVAGKVVPVCGLVIDCDAGLSNTCQADALPRLSDGKLPSELETPSALRLGADIYAGPVPADAEYDYGISESFTTSLSLPYCETFDSSTAVGFSPVGDSLFGFAADDSPAEDSCCSGPPVPDTPCCQDVDGQPNSEQVFEIDCSYGTVAREAQTRTNISVFVADIQSHFRKYTTDLKVEPGYPGSRQNGGIVINYRWNETYKIYEFWLVLLNVEAGSFGIYFFNGVSLVLQSPSVIIPELRANDWYRLIVTVLLGEGNNTKITATLRGIYDPGVEATLTTSVRNALFMPDQGQVGLYASRSRTLFSFFRIEEVAE